MQWRYHWGLKVNLWTNTMKNKSWDVKLHNKHKPKCESASGKADRRMSQVSQPSLLQTYYPWTLAYYARTQVSVPCRQNINLCQYRLSQITWSLNVPIVYLPHGTNFTNWTSYRILLFYADYEQAKEHDECNWRKCCILQVRIRMGSSKICSDIWHKYHEWYFNVIHNFRRHRRVKFGTILK